MGLLTVENHYHANLADPHYYTGSVPAVKKNKNFSIYLDPLKGEHMYIFFEVFGTSFEWLEG